MGIYFGTLKHIVYGFRSAYAVERKLVEFMFQNWIYMIVNQLSIDSHGATSLEDELKFNRFSFNWKFHRFSSNSNSEMESKTRMDFLFKL